MIDGEEVGFGGDRGFGALGLTGLFEGGASVCMCRCEYDEDA
jgi:hypothetical protein